MVMRKQDQKAMITSLIHGIDGDPVIKKLFIQRLNEGKLTRDENPQSHLCVFFAAFDPKERLFFLGHHIKADKWIFNGGHIDRGEMPDAAVRREITEEWGPQIHIREVGTPKLLTIKPIEHPERLICQYHFDMWYFIPVSKRDFHPDPELLATEFHETGWKTVDEANRLVTDENTVLGMRYIEQNLF